MKVDNLIQVISAVRNKPDSIAKFKMTISNNLFSKASAEQAIENIQNIARQYGIRCFVDTTITGLMGLSNDHKIVLEGKASNLIPVLRYIEDADDV
jgi:hypothetical protein